jgi:hypothetical protein
MLLGEVGRPVTIAASVCDEITKDGQRYFDMNSDMTPRCVISPLPFTAVTNEVKQNGNPKLKKETPSRVSHVAGWERQRTHRIPSYSLGR